MRPQVFDQDGLHGGETDGACFPVLLFALAFSSARPLVRDRRTLPSGLGEDVLRTCASHDESAAGG